MLRLPAGENDVPRKEMAGKSNCLNSHPVLGPTVYQPSRGGHCSIAYIHIPRTRARLFHLRIILLPSKQLASTTINALSSFPSGGDSRFLLIRFYCSSRMRRRNAWRAECNRVRGGGGKEMRRRSRRQKRFGSFAFHEQKTTHTTFPKLLHENTSMPYQKCHFSLWNACRSQLRQLGASSTQRFTRMPCDGRRSLALQHSTRAEIYADRRLLRIPYVVPQNCLMSPTRTTISALFLSRRS